MASLRALEDGLLELADGHLLPVQGVRSGKVAVCGDDLVRADARQELQGVDVLRVAPEQPALLLQQLHEVVRQGRRVLLPCGPQIPGELVERIRLLAEVLDVENVLRARQVVALQIRIEAGAGRAEVRDAGGCRHPGANHADDVPRVLLPHVPREAVHVGAGERRLRSLPLLGGVDERARWHLPHGAGTGERHGLQRFTWALAAPPA
mmetsp:Transcript_122512/g.354104  ORF Transcript_122512/g.354104 Transcript_122512/m.354104 type:complete len:207 (+) Transcript_122512:438-1058(+)